ncbi:MAG TPA: HIT domain-containing protein [Candidatus Acidoferrales bacterium]|jgi:ATP adenylyltransferase|nr:HIT domain-containing protein [Candidatus Acidoferrales bacterium]
MDYLWTPWRYRYVTEAKNQSGCVFCNASGDNRDEEWLIVRRAVKNFIILNRYPYTAGHVMIVPYLHTADFAGLEKDTAAEMMLLSQQVQAAIDDVYHPDGFNLGMNLGRSAGAGIADHLHMHLLPRWTGDTNFMTTVSETRLEPEELSVTYTRLRKALAV